jgi:hypothetical protein
LKRKLEFGKNAFLFFAKHAYEIPQQILKFFLPPPLNFFQKQKQEFFYTNFYLKNDYPNFVAAISANGSFFCANIL